MVICQIDGNRPARIGLGEYIFFFELEVPAIKNLLFDAVDDVRRKCIWLKNLGVFPVINA